MVDAVDAPELARRLDDLATLAGNPSARNAARLSVEALTLPAMAERLLALYRRLSAG